MFYIRTDANESIALGHLMRCLAIADAVKSLGEDVTFLKADEYENKRITEAGYAVVCLNSDWKDMEGELPGVKSYIADRKITAILVDSYQVTTRYLEELHQLVNVFYMDDLAEQAYPVDAVINYALADYRKTYERLYTGRQTKFLLGSKYAPLRKAFQNIKTRELRKDVSDILVTTGGSDPYHILYLAATKLATDPNYSDVTFHLVLGAFVEEQEANMIFTEAKKRGNIKYYQNISNIEDLMQECDLAISAAGSTLYELCACQTPTICFAFADNQLPAIVAMKQTDIMSTIGDIRSMDELQIEFKLKKEINKFQSCMVRDSYTKCMHMVTDGNGAIRLAEELIKIRK